MLEASIGTIIWFIIKVAISLSIVFLVGSFLFGLIKLLIERSNGSIFKMLFKILIIFIVGGIIAYFFTEIVSYYFSNGEVPTSGGIWALFLLIIYGLSKLTGSFYSGALILAFIVWSSFMYYVVASLFGATKAKKQENHTQN